jgi:benzoyl-CoA reductase/2-hydroxyglutaryl-CoA dehydratase subunit BcrC/BadD/HgdB
MKTIAYCSPFVPPEWIAAHGMRPVRPRLCSSNHLRQVGTGRATCPYAGALIDEVLAGIDASALVVTSTCDQMRLAAAVLTSRGDLPVFLMNVPSTWKTPGPGQLYREELQRLGRFLVSMGGSSPTKEQLVAAMMDYDQSREIERGAAPRGPETGVPIAVLGGPLLDKDLAILDMIERAGGRIVLDATEGGERTLPARFHRQRIRKCPFTELVRAYFATIPDAFRRPNDGLYEWLERELEARNARGILFHRYVWCDMWHAELQRLKEWSRVPVLEIDECDDDASLGRTVGRIEAFLEMLR